MRPELSEIAELAESFRTAMKAANRSERTQELRLLVVRYYCEWLERNGREATKGELTRGNVREWMAEMGGYLEPVTVFGYFAGLRRFCNWLVEEGELEESPLKGLEPPQVQDKPVPIFNDDELARLVKACSGRTFQCRRDEAYIRLSLDCGVRVSEACGLSLGDVDTRDQSGMVLGKGRKLRPIYFGPRTALALDRYLRERAKHPYGDLEALFLGQRGALTPKGAQQLLRQRAKQAGLEGRIHPHRFRHSWAHDFLLNGGQERDLKRLAGWSSDTMLERYGSSAADARAREATRRLRRGDRV